MESTYLVVIISRTSRVKNEWIHLTMRRRNELVVLVLPYQAFLIVRENTVYNHRNMDMLDDDLMRGYHWICSQRTSGFWQGHSD